VDATPTAPAPQVSTRLASAGHGLVPGCSTAPWTEDTRGEAPAAAVALHTEHGWLELDGFESLAEARPCPGVAPGARARHHGPGRFVHWSVLDRCLAGIQLRKSRKGDAWIWRADRPALETMAAVHAQTSRAADIGRADMREPDWLRDPELALSPSELRLLTAVVSQYQAGWGGLYDVQSTIATEVVLCSDRQLRNLLNGTSWVLTSGEKRRRPGLIERNLITAVRTNKPGSATSGPPSLNHWLILRPGPALELLAAIHTTSLSWTPRAPRDTGWTKGRSRKARRVVRDAARQRRRDASTAAWADRRRWSGDGGRRGSVRPASCYVDAMATEPVGATWSTDSDRADAADTPARGCSRYPDWTPPPPPTGPLVDLDELQDEVSRRARPKTAAPTEVDRRAALEECAAWRARDELVALVALVLAGMGALAMWMLARRLINPRQVLPRTPPVKGAKAPLDLTAQTLRGGGAPRRKAPPGDERPAGAPSKQRPCRPNRRVELGDTSDHPTRATPSASPDQHATATAQHASGGGLRRCERPASTSVAEVLRDASRGSPPHKRRGGPVRKRRPRLVDASGRELLGLSDEVAELVAAELERRESEDL
jgi:hypothetical protein